MSNVRRHMLVNKACTIVLRETLAAKELLVFEHPLAGVQLVKGTIEPGELPEHAALRELCEESGICPAFATLELGRQITKTKSGRSGFVSHILRHRTTGFTEPPMTAGTCFASSGTPCSARCLSSGIPSIKELCASSKMPSNPSIEGMPKRLRLLCTPHVKR
jgi:ADP-ribose pyrophosphatase YjhB (NUDIX family)